MKAELLVNITYNQVLELVRKLPKQEKIKLSKELEKEEITNKLSKLLNAFKENLQNIEYNKNRFEEELIYYIEKQKMDD